MWVFTTDGFMSAVEERSGEHHGEIVVRARERGVLDRLREIAPSATAVAISNTRDYRYRLWLSRQAWADALGQLQERGPGAARPVVLRGGAA